MTKIKDIDQEKRWFIVMNSQSEYYCGLMYGGNLVWSHDYKEAKPLDHEDKFRRLQSICHGEELIMDYI